VVTLTAVSAVALMVVTCAFISVKIPRNKLNRIRTKPVLIAELFFFIALKLN
jgi:hypothetical protein